LKVRTKEQIEEEIKKFREELRELRRQELEARRQAKQSRDEWIIKSRNEGKTYSEIAKECGLKSSTVKAIYQKLSSARGLPRVLKRQCRNGHPYVEGSFYIGKSGYRVCKECESAGKKRAADRKLRLERERRRSHRKFVVPPAIKNDHVLKEILSCAFCGKEAGAVEVLIEGPDKIYLCDECVEASMEMINEHKGLRSVAISQYLEGFKDGVDAAIRVSEHARERNQLAAELYKEFENTKSLFVN
jgi:hypothetical protein